MKKFSDAYVVSKWRAAVKLAGECMNAVETGFPDQAQIYHLAGVILASDLGTGGAQSTNKRAGQDADQESMLQDAYEDGSAAKF